MKDEKGCFGIIAIVIVAIILLCNLDVCHKDYYQIKSVGIEQIIINTTTDVCHIRYSNGDVIHIGMDKTRVKVDSTDRKIIVGLKEYKF